MKQTLLALFMVFCCTQVAWAQGAGTTVDPQTGNTYRWMQNPDGSTYIQGTNPYTGSQWNTNVQPNGNMQGRDANGNPWNYNKDTGVYRNSDGTLCVNGATSRRCF